MSITLSASAIGLARRCMRKAAFKYASDYPKEPFTAATELGSELHDAQERFHKEGWVPDPDTHVGKLFRASLPYIPAPGRGVAESKQYLRINGHEYVVIMDWYGQSDDLPEAPDGMPAILDFKTSSNPKKYGVGVSADKPAIDDPQVIIYSAFALVDNRAQEVYGRWLYLPTKTKRVVPVPSNFHFSRDEIQEAFACKIQSYADQLVQIRLKRPDPNTVAPNVYACDDFRGCWYAEKNGGPCRLTDQDIRDAQRRALLGEETDMGLLDIAKQAEREAEGKAEEAPAPAPKPKAKAKAKAEPAPVEAPAPAEAPTPTEDRATLIGRAVLEIVKAFRGE